MRLTVKEILLTLACAAALFLIAWLSYSRFVDFSLPRIEGALFHVTDLGSSFMMGLKFSCIWAAIPILILLTWKLIPELSSAKKAVTVLLVAGGVFTAIIIRKFALVHELESLVISRDKFPGINTNFVKSLNEVNYEYWMTVGLLAGTILCFILFRKKKNNARNSKITHQKI